MPDARQQITQAIRESKALPTVPGVALEILKLSRDPNVSIDKLAAVMEKDPALAAKTLRFANSSFYGTSQPILKLSQALVRIGVRGARLLALSFSLVDSCARGAAQDCEFFHAFWYRSLATSVLARRIASRSLRQHMDSAFVAALLADLGCVVLNRAFPDQYRVIGRQFRVGTKELFELERAAFGLGHPEAGALLLASWGMPEELSKVVGGHHDLAGLTSGAPDGSYDVAVIVMAASRLADLLILGGAKSRVERTVQVFRKFFPFGAQHIQAILHDVGPEISSVGQLLDVGLPAVQLLESDAHSEMLRLALEAGSGRPASPAPNA